MEVLCRQKIDPEMADCPDFPALPRALGACYNVALFRASCHSLIILRLIFGRIQNYLP